jgi:hypothetical protein
VTDTVQQRSSGVSASWLLPRSLRSFAAIPFFLRFKPSDQRDKAQFPDLPL